MRIATKAQFVKLWLDGTLGNRVGAWRTLEGFMHSEEPLGTIRFIELGRPTQYNVPREEMPKRVWQLEKAGYRRERLYFNGGVGASRVLFQGEYSRVGGIGYYVCGCAEPDLYMKEAMSKARHYCAVSAQRLLSTFMTPSSYEDLMALDEMYPNHVVEFGIYSGCVGHIPGRNTIIWEVRDY